MIATTTIIIIPYAECCKTEALDVHIALKLPGCPGAGHAVVSALRQRSAQVALVHEEPDQLSVVQDVGGLPMQQPQAHLSLMAPGMMLRIVIKPTNIIIVVKFIL